MTEGIVITDPELQMLLNNKTDGFNYRMRRHSDWTENYELYRDRVTYNRLTQRQSVNLPIMKLFIQTLLANVDNFPVIQFENLDNNKSAEIFKNEYWRVTVDDNNMEINDIVDKKQVFLFGRTYDQWQVMGGKVKQTIIDPMDIKVSRYTDPTNIHSSRFLIHENIFVPLSTLKQNPDYNQEAIGKLELFYKSQLGVIKAEDNENSLTDKNKKMSDLGVPDVEDPVLGETYVQLTNHFVYREETDGSQQLYLYVEAEDMCILMKKPLEEVIGVTKDHFWRTHYPYESWADDVDRQDWYTDGKADMIRTPNKIINSMYAQEVENRTLKNFNMKYYDGTKDWQPPTNQPLVPGGWYPLPGKPSEVFQLAEVANLGESLPFIEFLKGVIEQASGATPQLQGTPEKKQITLGQFQGLFSQAQERVKGMSKFYTKAWERRGVLFDKMCEAAGDDLDAVKIHKKGKNTSDIYTRDISAKDWETPLGYAVRVWSQDDKNNNDMQQLQKLNSLLVNIPNNSKVKEIFDRKSAEWAGCTPEEVNAIMEEEKRKADVIASVANAGANAGGTGITPTPTPALPAPMQKPPMLTA